MIPYTYVVLKYVHDAGAGEMLNVGVVLLAPEAHFADVRVETKFERLSQTFKGFEGPRFRRALQAFVSAFKVVQSDFNREPLLSQRRYTTAGDVVRSLWPDLGLSFAISEPLAGITSNAAAEVDALFDRMVTSLYDKKEAERRTDDQVWKDIYQPVLPLDVVAQLSEKSFETNEVSYKFDHAFKNGAWHVIQPVSMDYVSPDSIQRKATQWVGTTVGLEEVQELGTIYFLLGKPTGHTVAYERAKSLLAKAPINKHIVEEHQKEIFAAELADLVRKHSDH